MVAVKMSSRNVLPGMASQGLEDPLPRWLTQGSCHVDLAHWVAECSHDTATSFPRARNLEKQCLL